MGSDEWRVESGEWRVLATAACRLPTADCRLLTADCIQIHSLAVGAAMAQHIDHPLERGRLQGFARFVPHRAGNTTHEGV
jgi:hypothetical protein